MFRNARTARKKRRPGTVSRRNTIGPRIGNKRRRIGPMRASRVIRRKRTRQMSTGGAELTRSRHRLRLKKYNLTRRVNNQSSSIIYRFQGLTNFDVNGGFFAVRNADGPSGQVEVPLHFYDLTVVNDGVSPANMAWYMLWNSTAATAQPIRGTLPVQNSTGTVVGPGIWIPEEENRVNLPQGKSFLHKWTEIKMNLYGARVRPTKFILSLVRFPNSLYDVIGNTSTRESKSMMEYLTRPLMWSNLMVGQPEVRKYMKVVKQWTYNVDAKTSYDLNTASGNIHEVKIFVRHNTRYIIDWKSPLIGVEETASHLQGAQYITTDEADDRTGPRFPRRLYLMVQAFSPVRTAGGAIDVDNDPSYDILMRNCVEL